MTVLYRSSTTPEVQYNRPTAPVHEQGAELSAGRHGAGLTSWFTPSKPAGDGSTATGSSRSFALAPISSVGNCKKGTTTNGAPLADQDSSTASNVGQVLFLQESLSTSCSRESYKPVKSAGQEGYGGSTNGRPRPR